MQRIRILIIVKNPTYIVATILAKNEEDIIGKNIEHHINQGISHFIVTDNNSTDATRSIVQKYPEVKEIIDEQGDNHDQSTWVTHMARLACRLNPDWIVHLDADELWMGLGNLKRMDCFAFSSTSMYLHPPALTFDEMRHYLDFDELDLPGECKVGHRPDPEIVLFHGNHGFNRLVVETKDIWRHHYPIRSYEQFRTKALGHEALKRRNAICERWEKWHNLLQGDKLSEVYDLVCRSWARYRRHPNHEDLINMMRFWSTKDVVGNMKELPKVGKYAI